MTPNVLSSVAKNFLMASSIEKEAYYLSIQNQQALSSSSNVRSASSLLPLKMYTEHVANYFTHELHFLFFNSTATVSC
ncbi:hypothetical protein EMCRGX_G024461 [Ephydatia muelleri]